MAPKELLESVDHVLMSFEGTVCTTLPQHTMAGRLRLLLAEAKLPERVTDPIAILRHARTYGVATAAALNKQLTALEYEAVLTVGVAPGAREMLASLRATGTVVTIVSSLAPQAIRSFLILHDLQDSVKQIAARASANPDLLPPSPHLIDQAVHRRGIPKEACVFVGTSRQDRKAARAAGVRVVSSLPNPSTTPSH